MKLSDFLSTINNIAPAASSNTSTWKCKLTNGDEVTFEASEFQITLLDLILLKKKNVNSRDAEKLIKIFNSSHVKKQLTSTARINVLRGSDKTLHNLNSLHLLVQTGIPELIIWYFKHAFGNEVVEMLIAPNSDNKTPLAYILDAKLADIEELRIIAQDSKQKNAIDAFEDALQAFETLELENKLNELSLLSASTDGTTLSSTDNMSEPSSATTISPFAILANEASVPPSSESPQSQAEASDFTSEAGSLRSNSLSSSIDSNDFMSPTFLKKNLDAPRFNATQDVFAGSRYPLTRYALHNQGNNAFSASLVSPLSDITSPPDTSKTSSSHWSTVSSINSRAAPFASSSPLNAPRGTMDHEEMKAMEPFFIAAAETADNHHKARRTEMDALSDFTSPGSEPHTRTWSEISSPGFSSQLYTAPGLVPLDQNKEDEKHYRYDPKKLEESVRRGNKL